MAKKVNIWVGVYPLTTNQIETLQQQLAPVIPKEFKKELSPHVTVLQCNLPENEIDGLRTKARQLGLIGQSFETTGLRAHPNLHNPEVIVVDAAYDLSPARTELEAYIEQHGGEVFGGLAPAHITLWKAPFNVTLDSQTSQQITDAFADAHQEELDTWHSTVGAIETTTF